MPDPTAPNPHHPRGAGYQWRAGQKRRTPSLPRLRPDEARAQLEAEHARRRVEEQAERARIRAGLAAEKAQREAYSDKAFEEFLAGSRWLDNSPGNGHGDVRNIKF